MTDQSRWRGRDPSWYFWLRIAGLVPVAAYITAAVVSYPVIASDPRAGQSKQDPAWLVPLFLTLSVLVLIGLGLIVLPLVHRRLRGERPNESAL